MKKIIMGTTLAATTFALALFPCALKQTSLQPDLAMETRAVKVQAASLNANQLTPKQAAALVLYYGDAHMPGAKQRDYSSHMAASGQGAVVKIYDKDMVPKGEGPLYKTYPDGASLLYSVKLTQGAGRRNGHLDSIYYTIAGNKFYFEDSDAGINSTGVTAKQMVAYAKQHGGVSRVLNVAGNTKIQDMRVSGLSSQSNATNDLSTQQLGTLVALYAQPDWFKAGVSSGDIYYGTYQKTGYSYVTANGDPTSWVYFKRNGDNVTVKYVHPEGDESVAETKPTTKHITVSGLVRDYYTNQSQKDEVNGYANKLKPESEYHNN